MLPALVKKVAPLILGLWVLVFVGNRIVQYMITNDTPAFLVDMEEHLAENPKIVARLGEDARYTYTYNEPDLKKDSLPYSFSLNSSKGRLQIKGVAVQQQGQWVPVKADTVFISAQ